MKIKVFNKTTNKYLKILENYNLKKKITRVERKIENKEDVPSNVGTVYKRNNGDFIHRTHVTELYIEVDSFDFIPKLDKELKEYSKNYKGIYLQSNPKGEFRIKII